MLPFIIVHTNKDTVIECEMDEEGTEVFFNFSQPFEIHDDNEVCKKLGLILTAFHCGTQILYRLQLDTNNLFGEVNPHGQQLGLPNAVAQQEVPPDPQQNQQQQQWITQNLRNKIVIFLQTKSLQMRTTQTIG